jgi:2-desacetyl-2-hydroxyethyl bacteriochlorophyllide A dehydrogenase
MRCGICGSDLSYAKIGGIPGAASPFAIGHEFSGIVAATGSEVSQVKPGDRVVINPERGGNGIGSNGERGAFTPFVLYRDAVAHPEGLLALPDELEFEQGALVEPLSVGLHAVRQGNIAEGDRVAVMGAGPIGLSAALCARQAGAADVTVIDVSEKRLEAAGGLGFATICNTSTNLAETLSDMHGTVNLDPLLGSQPATDVFIEATGAGPVFEQLLSTARKGATVVVVGVHFEPVSLDMLNFLIRELRLVSACAYADEFPDVIAMLASGVLDVMPMISHQYPLSRFEHAFAIAGQPDTAVKVMIDCQA